MAAIVLLCAGGIFAQNTRELRLGSSLSGNLREGDEHWFSIRSSEFGFIVVETTSDMDTWLEAYDAYRDFIASDDDGGDDYNARLEILADAGQTYLFLMRGFNDEVSGPYRIWAGFRPIPAATELFSGSSLSGSFDAGEDRWYSFRPAQTGYVIVETTGDTDTYLTAYDASYNAITYNDDGGDGFNARIEMFAEAGKTYYFRLNGYDDDENGPYRLWTSFEVIPPDTDRNTERIRALTIRLGEGFTGYLRTSSESRWYRYDLTRQAQFIVQTRSAIDTVMYLYDSFGNLITEDDDSGEDNNAMISERLNAGTYYIEVKEYSGQTGRFSVHAEIR